MENNPYIQIISSESDSSSDSDDSSHNSEKPQRFLEWRKTQPIERERKPYSFIPEEERFSPSKPPIERQRNPYSFVPQTGSHTYRKREREYNYVPRPTYKKPKSSKFTRTYRPKSSPKRSAPSPNTYAAHGSPFNLVPGICPEPNQYDQGCSALFDNWAQLTRNGGSKKSKKDLLLLTHPDKSLRENNPMYPYQNCTAFGRHCFDKVNQAYAT